MIVYIVTTDHHSDYMFDKIFLNKSRAESWATLIGGEIEQWEVDTKEKAFDTSRTPYEATMSINGDNAYADKFDFFDFDEILQVGDNGLVSSLMFATDENHAIKILNERRIAYLLNKEGSGE